MPWLADSDVGAANGCARGLSGAETDAALRRCVLEALGGLVPADFLSWDRVELATGAVDHEALPAEAEPRGGFEAVVGRATDHPLLAAHTLRRSPALRISELVDAHRLHHSDLYGDLLHPSGVEYEISVGMRASPSEATVLSLGRTDREFSERDRDVLDIARAAIEDGLRDARARARLASAIATRPPPGTALMLLDRDGEIELSSPDADRWLAEHFEPAEHPGWLPSAVAEWLALPPRPPLVRERDGRRLTIRLLPGSPHALLLDEQVTSIRTSALDRFGVTPRETEVLRAAAVNDDETEIAWQLTLSLHAVRQRLEHLEAKLGVSTPAEAVARALGESA